MLYSPVELEHQEWEVLCRKFKGWLKWSVPCHGNVSDSFWDISAFCTDGQTDISILKLDHMLTIKKQQYQSVWYRVTAAASIDGRRWERMHGIRANTRESLYHNVLYTQESFDFHWFTQSFSEVVSKAGTQMHVGSSNFSGGQIAGIIYGFVVQNWMQLHQVNETLRLQHCPTNKSASRLCLQLRRAKKVGKL